MIQITPILPVAFNAAVFEQEFVRAMGQITDAFDHDFQLTTQTWNTQVAFTKRTTVSPSSVIGKVVTKNDIYKFVTRGTQIRYAAMTPDFLPKTIPGVIGSFTGRGGFDHLDFANPRPGIRARRFEETLRDKYKKSVATKFQVAVNRAVDRTGHKFV